MKTRRLLAVPMAVVFLGLFSTGTPAHAAQDELAPKHVLKTAGGGAVDNGLPDNSNGQATPGGDAKPNRPGGSSNGINYHGGPVILNTTNAYVIWYGTWAAGSQSILTNLLSNIGGSPYFNINTTYYNGSNVHVSNSVNFAGSTTDSYSFGKSLSDSNIQQIVASAINSGRLTNDTNGVYFVLTAADVAETSGFLTQYCGWHTRGTISGSDIKYAFVGDPTKGMSACAAQTTSPNGNAPADAMASVVSHELEEAVTDPDLNAWYDTRGQENADKCAWTWGTLSTASNGSKYNMTLGGLQYLIQRNWVNALGGYCAVSY